jgi:hypothetical protein
MRVALVIALVTFTLRLASQPVHGQMPSSSAPALEAIHMETIHMVDAQSGWLFCWIIRLGHLRCYARATAGPSGETSRRSDPPVKGLKFGKSARFPLLLRGSFRPIREVLALRSSVPLTAVARGRVLPSTRMCCRFHSSTPTRDGFSTWEVRIRHTEATRASFIRPTAEAPGLVFRVFPRVLAVPVTLLF